MINDKERVLAHVVSADRQLSSPSLSGIFKGIGSHFHTAVKWIYKNLVYDTVHKLFHI